MQNTYIPGKRWNGETSTQPTITYNGETKTAQQWAKLLESDVHTLCYRMREVQKGNMTFDKAMENKAQRKTSKSQRMRHALAEKKRNQTPKLTKKAIAHKKDAALNNFLYGTTG